MAAPDQETVQKAYDHLDFSRGTEAFLTGMRNQGIGITEELMDARSLFLTPNSTTVYVFMCLDLDRWSFKYRQTCSDRPMPPIFGCDRCRIAGPDKGNAGRHLFVPPGYTGNIPTEDYFVQKPQTNTGFACLSTRWSASNEACQKMKCMRDRAVTEFQILRHPSVTGPTVAAELAPST